MININSDHVHHMPEWLHKCMHTVFATINILLYPSVLFVFNLTDMIVFENTAVQLAKNRTL